MTSNNDVFLKQHIALQKIVNKIYQIDVVSVSVLDRIRGYGDESCNIELGIIKMICQYFQPGFEPITHRDKEEIVAVIIDGFRDILTIPDVNHIIFETDLSIYKKPITVIDDALEYILTWLDHYTQVLNLQPKPLKPLDNSVFLIQHKLLQKIGKYIEKINKLCVETLRVIIANFHRNLEYVIYIYNYFQYNELPYNPDITEKNIILSGIFHQYRKQQTDYLFPISVITNILIVALRWCRHTYDKCNRIQRSFTVLTRAVRRMIYKRKPAPGTEEVHKFAFGIEYGLPDLT